MNNALKWCVAVATLIGLPLSTAWAGAPTTNIDKDGCETVNGYNQINRCNSSIRTDGTSFLVRHEDVSFRGDGAGTSAFASLYCSFGYSLYKGAVQSGEVRSCRNGEADSASKSTCGPFVICGQK